MKGRIAAALAIVAMVAVSLVTYVASASADPIQVWNGDLDGSTNATKIVTGLQGKPLPTSGSGVLTWDGGSWFFGPSVAPNLAGQALFTNDAGTSTTWAYPHGDVDASATDPGALTVNAIQGFGVSNAVPSSTNVLAYSSGLWRPTALTTANITPGTAGQFLVTNGTPATAWSTLDTFDTTHGRITAGGGGSDVSLTCGPQSGAETTTAACVASANASGLVYGTNKAGATLSLQAGAALGVMTLQNASANTNETDLLDPTGATQAKVTVNDLAGVFAIVTPNNYQLQFSTQAGAQIVLGNTQDVYNVQSGSHTFEVNGSTIANFNSSGATIGTSSGANTLNGSTDFAPMTAPSSPAANTIRVYTDTADGKLKAKDSSGNIFVLAP